MPTINQLSALSTLTDGDLLPVFSTTNGDARKVSMAVLKEFVNEADNSNNGILGLSSFFTMRKTGGTVALTTAYQNITNWTDTVITTPNSDSLSTSLVLGEFVAGRDISHIQFNALLVGSWPTNRDLQLGVLIGSDASPYESSFRYIGPGRGAGTLLTANFGGLGANLNNGGNVIKAGEKIRLVAKFNTADNLNIDRLLFSVQTLDGQ